MLGCREALLHLGGREGEEGTVVGGRAPVEGEGDLAPPKAPPRVPEPLTSTTEQLPLVVTVSTFFSVLSMAKVRTARASCREQGGECQEGPRGFREGLGGDFGIPPQGSPAPAGSWGQGR